MSSKRSARAMPVETIITRFKSRNQQFDNERHKNDTKPKSQMTKRKSSKQDIWKPKLKPSKDFQKSIKPNDVGTREFYPDKLKRKIEYKKVVLKPKHSMKMIGGTNSCNKRKLHMPRKEIKRTRHNSNTSTLSEIESKSPKHKDQAPELTIKDMVLLIEEEGGLSDEDLLEILTCPSPVWWEDPPTGYIEDPIFARTKPEEQKSVKNQLLEEQNKEAERRKQRDEQSALKAKDAEHLDVSKLGISIESRGVNFMNKRCKLESLLGNIRNNVKKDSESLKKVGNNVFDVLNAKEGGNDKNKNQTMELNQKKGIAKIQISEKCDKNHNEGSTPKSDNNREKNCINQEDITTGYREKRSSDSCEDDQFLDLEDHEILSLENIEIPIAHNNVANPNEISEAPVTINEKIDKKTIESLKSNTKISSVMLDNGLGTETDSTKKKVHRIRKILTVNKLASNDVMKYKNIIPTNPIITKHQNTNNQTEEINKKNKKQISFIRVKKHENLFNFKSNCKINISQNYLSNNDDNTKNRAASNKQLFSADPKDDIRLNNMKLVKTVGTSNIISDILPSSNIKPSVNLEISNFLSESKDVRSTAIALNDNLSEIESFKNINNHLNEIGTPFLVDDNMSSDRTNKEACIEIGDVDLDDNINNLSVHNNRVNDKIVQKNTSIQNKNKITDNHGQNKSIYKISIYKARRRSADSATSDKNMSEEYLDMSLLDEDERKIDLDTHNNDFNYESDDFQSQSDSQSCNKSNHINFKSDLDMTDSNMYEQINESCNNDIIKYIRDNRKDIDAEKEKAIADIKTLNDDFTIKNNFKTSSPTPEKEHPTKKTEYVEVYKIINSDSDDESDLLKTNGVKIGELNEINEGNLKKINGIEESAIVESNETNVVASNEIDVSEFITYEEEYLTEFDEIETIGHENNEGNFIKIGEIRDSALNTSKNRNEINNAVTENIHNQGNVINVNAENTLDKKNDNVYLTKISEVSGNIDKNPDNLSTADSSKTNDIISKHINNYYKHRKDIRKIKIRPDDKLNKENHENDKKIECKSCSFKNKSILISENETIKYCLVCSSIYDTDNCKYCIKRFKKECTCKKFDLEYECDKCNIKVCDKEAIIEHLKQNCKMDSHTAP